MNHNNINFEYFPLQENYNACDKYIGENGVYITDVISYSGENFYYWVSFDLLFSVKKTHLIYYRSSKFKLDINSSKWIPYINGNFLSSLSDPYLQIMIVGLESGIIIDQISIKAASRTNTVYFYTKYIESYEYNSVLISSSGNIPKNNVKYFVSKKDSVLPEDYTEIVNRQFVDLPMYQNAKGFKLKIEMIGVSEQDYGIDSIGVVLFGEKQKGLST